MPPRPVPPAARHILKGRRGRARRMTELAELSSASADRARPPRHGGSVDDGKSTLIGRLLYDTKQVFADQLEHVEETSERRGDGYVEPRAAHRRPARRARAGHHDRRRLPLLRDRRGGASTSPTRPGHVQYTRNMVTGASTADVAIVLVDARKGVVEQTRRHAYIAALLGIPHLVVARQQDGPRRLRRGALRRDRGRARASSPAQLGVRDAAAIPIIALHGDNVVEPLASACAWYEGPTLLEHLETVEVAADRDLARPALPRAVGDPPRCRDEHHDYRGYAGQVAGGVVAPGDEVLVLPSGRRTRVAAVETSSTASSTRRSRRCRSTCGSRTTSTSAAATCSPTRPTRPTPRARSTATVCWMSERPVQPGRASAQAHDPLVTRRARADGVDRSTSTRSRTCQPTGWSSTTSAASACACPGPLLVDPYAANRATGAFILIDEATNDTVGAGMVLGAE